MTADITVGIIICARNMENYIKPCLMSCVFQARFITELHIINDGSTDGTKAEITQFCNENINEKLRIYYYETPGCGPGKARNLALREITSDIVAFVDADDLINRKTLDTLADKMMQDGVDIGLASVKTFSERTGSVIPFDAIRQQLFSRMAAFSGASSLTTLNQTPALASIETSMCMKVFRNTLLRDHAITFTEGHFCEDVAPSIQSLCLAKSVLLLNLPYYYYRVDRPGQRTGQISSSSLNLLGIIKSIIGSTCFKTQHTDIQAQIIATLARMVPWTWSLLPAAMRTDFLRQVESELRILSRQLLRQAARQLPVSTSGWVWLMKQAWLPRLPNTSGLLLASTSKSLAILRRIASKGKSLHRRFFPLNAPQRVARITSALQLYTETGLIQRLALAADSNNDAREIVRLLTPCCTPMTSSSDTPVLSVDSRVTGHHRFALYAIQPQEHLHNSYPWLSSLSETFLVVDLANGNVTTHPASAYEISVIVPVFGVADYVGKCTDSLLTQNFSGRFEVLFINDGTTDRSVEIIRQRIADHHNFRIIDRPNGGAAAARNLGISEAKGKYICFVDGDDYVAEHYLQTLYNLICGSGAYVAQAAFAYVDDVTGKITTHHDQLRLKKNKSQAVAAGVDVMRNVPGIWRRIYCRDFMLSNALFFNPEFRRHDDLPFNIRTLIRAGDIPISHEPVYFYVIGRPGQDVSATDERMFIHFRLFNEVLNDEQISILKGKTYRTFLKVLFSHHLWSFTRLAPPFQRHYLSGFSQQLFNSPGPLSPVARYLVLMPAFAGWRRLLLKLLLMRHDAASKPLITDLNFLAQVAHDSDAKIMGEDVA